MLRRGALRSADLIVARTNDTANYVANQQDVPRERIRVLPWALDPQFVALLTQKPWPSLPANFPTGRVILTVGRGLADDSYQGMDYLNTRLSRFQSEWSTIQL